MASILGHPWAALGTYGAPCSWSWCLREGLGLHWTALVTILDLFFLSFWRCFAILDDFVGCNFWGPFKSQTKSRSPRGQIYVYFLMLDFLAASAAKNCEKEVVTKSVVSAASLGTLR